VHKVHKLNGIDLNAYKSIQMRRRLDSFVKYNTSGNVTDFCCAIEKQKQLLDSLRNYITINVSEFFSDPGSYEYLQKVVIPQLLKTRSKLNIWSAGCSHGQEAYSLRMLLDTIPGTHRILATDVDIETVNVARAGGPYAPETIKNVPATMLSKYFVLKNGAYYINQYIKGNVEFGVQNILDSCFEADFDLIICRDITNYFTDTVKNELNQKFFHSLRSGGVLFIGSTEEFLDVTKSGFASLTPSFYLKSKETDSQPGYAPLAVTGIGSGR
jgi:chemotaxis protein methyltransferase CheR